MVGCVKTISSVVSGIGVLANPARSGAFWIQNSLERIVARETGVLVLGPVAFSACGITLSAEIIIGLIMGRTVVHAFTI